MFHTGSTSESAATHTRLLLVDDDPELCRFVKLYLRQAGYELICCQDGREGAVQAVASPYSLVLLDVMLPSLDGFAVLRQVRQSSTVPVIMLTSRSMSADRLEGFDGGADDYLCKPFDPDELLARIRAVLRRSSETRAEDRQWREYGSIRLSENAREVWSEGQRVTLTETEFALLLMLSKAAGRVVERNALTVAIQERRPNPFDRSLDVHMSHLRSKLGRAGSMLRTVRGTGYLLAATMRRMEEGAR